MATKNPKGRGGGHSTSSERVFPAQGDMGGGKEKDVEGIYRNLVEELDDVKEKWESIGLKLGVKQSHLNVINDQNINLKHALTKCLSEMLYKWLRNTVINKDQIWTTVCNALKKSEELDLAETLAQKHGLYPKITKQPQDEHAELGGIVTFRCEASGSGSKISYEWFHIMCDGREVKKEAISAELDIKEVTEADRGNYSCDVKNDFGKVESQPAELIIGMTLNEENLRKVLREAGIKVTDWPEIGECLAIAMQDVRRAFVEGILKRIQKCPDDKTNLWQRIAQALEGMEGCLPVAKKAKENAGKELNESTVTEMFKAVDIKNPDWCKIGEELGHLATCDRHKQLDWEKFGENQQITEDAVKGAKPEIQAPTRVEETGSTISRVVTLKPGSESGMQCSEAQHAVATIFRHKNTWEQLTKALGQIPGYRLVAERAENNAEVEITYDTLCDVFMESSIVNWHQVAGKFSSFNESCLTEMLMRWYSKEKCRDPWIIWRKLAALVEEGINGPTIKEQLAIGYKLRLRSRVGLELTPDNFYKPLKEAGIKDWSAIVSGLKLDIDQRSLSTTVGRLVSFVQDRIWPWKSAPVHKEILNKWPKPQSWEELARVIEDSTDGPEIAQKIRKLSGSGGFPKIRYLGTPELKENNVKSGTVVTFTCEARGAPPLKYNWTHNGDDPNPQDSMTINLKMTRSVKYNCRVENDFGCDTLEYPKELKCGDPPTCKFDHQKIYIEIGKKLTLQCKATGTEKLRYTWLYKDKEAQVFKELPKEEYQESNLCKQKTRESDAGSYECQVENDYGKATSIVEVKVGNFGEVTSKPIGIKVGDKPKIKAPPKIAEKAVQGEQVRLTCEAEGKGPFKYVWMHNNQTLVKEAGSCKKKAELIIEQMTDAHQGKYKCCFTNAFGFKVSEPVTLQLEITLEDVTNKLCSNSSAQIPQRWYMLGILLEVEKAILSTISRSFATSEDSLEEVIRSWLEKKSDSQKPCSWATIRDAVCRMGYETLTQDLDAIPKIEAPLKVEGTAEYGERITLTCTCKAMGKPKFTWLRNDVEIHETNNSKFIIDSMDESDEGQYKCKVTNEVGSAISEAITLIPGLQIEKGILAQMQNEEDAAKPKIEAPLEVEGNVAYGEKITLTCIATGMPPFQYTWLCNDVETHVNNSKFTIDSMDETNEGEYKCKVSNEVGFAISEAVTLKPGSKIETGSLTRKEADGDAKYNAKDMSIKFENLAGNVEELLTNTDSSGTESGETERNTESDTAVSAIQAYLHLIKFKAEDIEKVEDLHSAIELLRQYWNYQRYHLLQKVIDQFDSEIADKEMEEFINHFSTYQATTTLGDFVSSIQLEGSSDSQIQARAILEGDPPITTVKNPPFMNSFKIKLESKWATCTLRDADNLLNHLLPDTVSREFVWSSVAYREKENYAVCLTYLVSPTVVELLNKEMKKRTKSMHSMGILCVQVDSDEFKPYKDTLGRSLRLPPGYQPYEDPLGRPLSLPPEFQSSITRSHFEEQGIPLEIQSPNMLKQQLEELKSVVAGYATKIEALQKDYEGYATKIEALQKDYETRSTYGPAIEALQTDLHTTKENLKKVSTQVKGQSEKSMTLGARIGVLDKKVDRNQQIAKKVIAEVTGKPVPSMTQHERVKQNITGEGMDESALAAAGSSTMTSEEQGNHQEPLDTTSVMKILKELLEGQQELREAQWRTESKIAEGSSAKISEGLRGKNE